MVTLDWSTDPIPSARRFEAWRQALSASHLDWQLDAMDPANVAARVRSLRLGEADFVSCRTTPCSGRRTKPQIARDAAAYFGLLYVRGGREIVSDHRGERELRAGDLLFWDSRSVQSFHVLEPLDKLTLLMPAHAVEAVLPKADRFAGTVLQGPLARLVRGSLDVLLEVCDELDSHQARAAAGTAVQGLANALIAADSMMPRAGITALMQKLMRYIDGHLQADDLTPARIARANGISVRYLHLLFTREGLSVSRWIKRRRLLRCQAELTQRPSATIAEIAHRWGFGDSAQLSRAFRSEFGCSPRAYRKSAA